MSSDPVALVDHLFRHQAGQMVATLTRRLGSKYISLAEDAVQDALMTALEQWPFRGVPQQPEAWLFQVARNRAFDRLRHQRMATEKSSEIAQHAPSMTSPSPALLRDEPPPMADDQLELIFLSCHPALPSDARVALALKLVGGFSIAEIARAFVSQESTIAQRLVRAKRVLRDHDIAFGMPDPGALSLRLDSVLETLYLTFNEGYAATSGDALVRDDVAAEAIRLSSMVAEHPVTGAPRAWALLALMKLHAARLPARADPDGSLFLLRDQDRSTWDKRLLWGGFQALERAAAGDDISQYHLEAGIAACHASAPSWESTDWPQILALYDDLLALTGSPIVAVNRAVALSRVEGPMSGLAALDAIADRRPLERYAMLPAIQAELWREAGDWQRAAECYRSALSLVRSEPERRWLMSRL